MIKTFSAFRTGLFALLFLLVLGDFSASAQSNAPAVSDRFLFIVDTSSAMRKRASAVEKAVGNLLRSSMAAQFESGDTVGVWTFNDQLHAGRFPLQTWTPQNTELIASNVVRFLKAQSFTGASRFDTVVPVLRRVVEESPRLTILLVSDGDEPIAGTPFDMEIRRALASKFSEQQKARMPFITVLRGARGRIASATVNLAPWPVEFPKFPPEPVAAEAPKPEVKPKPEPPRPTLPPLIVIGNKRLDPTAATNAMLTEATNGTLPATVAPGGNEPGSAPLQTNVAAPDPTTPQNLTPATSDSPTNRPVEPETKVVSEAPAATVAIAALTTSAEPARAVTEPAEPESTSATPNKPDGGADSSSASPTTEVAVATPAEPGSVPWLLILAGATPVVLGVAVFLVLQRRGRSSGRVSLITRSLDRDQK